MQLSRRQFVSLLAGAAAAASLSACAQPKRAVATLSPSTSATRLGGEGLDVWYHAYTDSGAKEAAARFAEEYRPTPVSVNWVDGDYPAAVTEALGSATPPAVFEFPNGPTLDMITSGQVADLTDLVKSVAGDFPAALLQRLTFKDRIWAIPQAVSAQFLYYRKSFFSTAGLKPPTTLVDLIAAAKALKTGARGGFFAGQDGGISTIGPLLIWAAGLEQLDSGRTKAAFNATALHDAATAWRGFFESGALLTSASTDWYDATPFAIGETAMQWGGIWSLPQVAAILGDDFGIIPFPAVGATGRAVVPFGAFASCVAAKSADVEAAKAYAKWLWIDEQDKQVEFATAYGLNIPARQPLVARAEAFSAGPGAEVAGFVKNHGRVDDIYWTANSASAYAQALADVVTGQADPKATFAEAAAKVDAELATLPR